MKSNNFILANLDASGFYRTNYESDNWKKIIEQLNVKKDVCTLVTCLFIN